MHWFTIEGPGVLDEPGIYQWWVGGEAIYTGRALRPLSRLAQYRRTIERMRAHLPYRRANPEGFRDIHYRLQAAVSAGAPVIFRVIENCAVDLLNARERHHQMQMVAHARFVDWQSRVRAEANILASVWSGGQADPAAVSIWLRGGATFWNDDHEFLSWGLHLPPALDCEIVEVNGLRSAIEELSDLHRVRFGSIALRAPCGRMGVAVTAWNGFTGDRLFGFFKSAECFRAEAEARGWLLGKQSDLADTLACMSDDELRSVWQRGALSFSSE